LQLHKKFDPLLITICNDSSIIHLFTIIHF